MSNSGESQTTERQWKPIGRNLRRVLGVLVEKAKTTPDNYPLTVSSLIAGCKQKSNRDPIMDLDEDEVVEALENLRNLGAVREVQGSGRVNKYRHCAYEWLDVNGPQAAIMTELLLRGPQTLGELRARASRMEPFDSLDVVAQVVDDLQKKGLVEPMTPPGRGQVFGHTLYEPHEKQKALEKAGASVGAAAEIPARPAVSSPATSVPHAAIGSSPTTYTANASEKSEGTAEAIESLRREVEELRARLEKLEAALQ